MSYESIINLFEGKKVRVVWNEQKEKYYFSVVDIVQVLTGSTNPRRYWSDLKRKLSAEGSELYAKIVQQKMPSSDRKKYLTDVADLEQTLCLIQSVPSPKADPLKLWLAEVGAQRIDQMIDPELTFQMAVEDYRRQGERVAA